MGLFTTTVSVAIVIFCSSLTFGARDNPDLSCPGLGLEDRFVNVTLYPVPDDCSSFFVCANGVLVKLHCSKGLLFNPILKVSFKKKNA